MRKSSAMKLHYGDEVEIRFLPQDTFTPKKWEPGIVVSVPIKKDDGVFVSVLLHSGCFVAGVRHNLIRSST